MYTPIILAKSDWNSRLTSWLRDFDVYAPLQFDESIEYELLDEEGVDRIAYNMPKPSSPVKTFFLPVRENLTQPMQQGRRRIVIGPPACDLFGLSLLDEIYIDNDYVDPAYARYRENTLLFGFDCHSKLEHCHCTSYGFEPVPGENADMIISAVGAEVILTPVSERGDKFIGEYIGETEQADESRRNKLAELRDRIRMDLVNANKGLPDYSGTGALICASGEEIWKRFSDTCVSCGACSAICPTCSCFLFIERPAFEKVRSLDTCQYPGFEKVAAGEDPLRPLPVRFRNRYLCKYVWKPEKFDSKACTGCGRCIEACIGEINKNDLFREISQMVTVSE